MIWTQWISPRTLDETVVVTADPFQAKDLTTGDVRATVVGHRVFVQVITTPCGALDWRRGNWYHLVHSPVDVPSPIRIALRSYLASFDPVFGCFDFTLTGPGHDPDNWWAIGCNPNGQWGWLPDAPAVTEAFADILSMEERGPLMMPSVVDAGAVCLREAMKQSPEASGVLGDPAWRMAVATVPRHRFVPGFHLPAREPDEHGATMWEPVTAGTDYGRWPSAAYSDITSLDAGPRRLETAAKALHSCG
ncbi:hypothetical protein [Streptomyces sp. LaBMicrA B280]|uniref:hypothetical protein n=1 Tax=Streptomyces sp. LaBMicrA B280 TaxID=3391001 RepID=UPI003BA62910